MSEKRLLTATRIVRNSIVLFAVAAMAKGFGLVIAVIVARYLGAEALGIYAVLMALTMILEIIAPLGQQDVVIREVAREPESMLRLWVESSATAFSVGWLFAIAIAVGGRIAGLDSDVQTSVDFAALGTPFASASLVAQAVLQGLERLKFLAVATFVARVISIVVLVMLLAFGVGVVAAFVCRLVFHLLTLAMLAMVLARHGRDEGMQADWRLSPQRLRARAVVALPFAAQRVLNEASMRGTVLVLPFLVAMQSVGLFDAADRIRQTVAMIIPIVMLSIMPAFSRTFRANRVQGAVIATYAMKFLLITILPMALLVAVAAPQIITLLYDSGYEQSVAILQIVIWAQVFLSADMILKQGMIASDHEHAMLRRTAIGLLVQVLATVALVLNFGIRGVAFAILGSSILILAMDAVFMVRQVVKLDFADAAAKPALCTAIAGAATFALSGQNILLIVAAGGLTYLIALFSLRTFSADELLLIRGIPGRLLKKHG